MQQNTGKQTNKHTKQNATINCNEKRTHIAYNNIAKQTIKYVCKLTPHKNYSKSPAEPNKSTNTQKFKMNKQKQHAKIQQNIPNQKYSM